MSARLVLACDRPPDGGLEARRARGSFARVLGIALTVLSLTCVAAWAQPGSPPRIDPGVPPEVPGGTNEGWGIVNIPGLPAGAELGDVWVSPVGDVFVWASYPTPTRASGQAATFDDPVEGEKLPNPGGRSNPRSSLLYHFNGASWAVSLSTPGETGVTLYGTAVSNLFATTTGAQGEARIYRFDGHAWTPEVLAGYYIGRLHTLAGVPGDLYLRIDRVILHRDGTMWTPIHELPGEFAATRGMVYVDPNHLFVLRPDGHDMLHNGVWSTVLADAAFADVEDAWGKVEDGQLHMYAVGSNTQDNGARLWRFNEMNPATHDGTWQTVLADPIDSGSPVIGSGFHIWGACCTEMYATGVVAGEGHFFYGDALTWTQLSPPFTLGAVHGVWGTGQGVVWFSTTEGRMVRYVRPEPAPVVSPAVPPVETRNPLAVKEASGVLQIHYELAQATLVNVGVYDITGRLRATVAEGFQASGAHDASWNLGTLVPGVYFVKVQAGGPAFTRRVVVLR